MSALYIPYLWFILDVYAPTTSESVKLIFFISVAVHCYYPPHRLHRHHQRWQVKIQPKNKKKLATSFETKM